MNRNDTSSPLIDKKIIHAGTASANFAPDAKVINTCLNSFFLHNNNVFFLQVKFHFTTQIVNEDSGDLKEIDDSRKFKEPVEILIGKKFKLEVWESAIQTMAVGEIAEFRVDRTVVSKSFSNKNPFKSFSLLSCVYPTRWWPKL